MRESEIEKKVTAYAKQKGWLGYKFVSPSQRGVPDRLYMRQGRLIFIEFKAPGKKPTKLQQKIAANIEAEGFTVYIVDNMEAGKAIFT